MFPKEPPLAPIHGVEVVNRAHGDAVVDSQPDLAIDDRDTAETMRAARWRCQAVIDDPAASEAELEEIGAWARKHMGRVEGSEQRKVRAIERLLWRAASRACLPGRFTYKPGIEVRWAA